MKFEDRDGRANGLGPLPVVISIYGLMKIRLSLFHAVISHALMSITNTQHPLRVTKQTFQRMNW